MEHITASTMTLERELTVHAQGYKQVFLRNDDTPTKLTQVAYGEFSSSDYCAIHSHITMEECFYFLKGKGVYMAGSQLIDLQSGVFVRIPAGVPHRLEATSKKPLEYIYFGVAVD